MAGRITDAERSNRLIVAVESRVLQGYRVESQTDFQAVLVRGRRVNHILHLFLSIFTCGLWIIVWLALGLFGGEKRDVVRVDERGVVYTRQQSWTGPHDHAKSNTLTLSGAAPPQPEERLDGKGLTLGEKAWQRLPMMRCCMLVY